MVGKFIPSDLPNYHASRIGRLFHFGFVVALILYGIWLVYIGMDGMAHPPCSGAAFFFAKVDLYHWYGTFLKVVFTITAVLCTLSIILSLKQLVSERRISKVVKDLFWFEAEAAPAMAKDEKVTLREISWFSLSSDS